MTFLVRPRRAAELACAGLVIKSPNGDVTLEKSAGGAGGQAERKIRRRAVELQGVRSRRRDQIVCAGGRSADTSIIPLLNGMLHLDVLDAEFGRDRVLGGLCAIAVTLNEKREVVQLQPMQSLNFGERDGKHVGPGPRHRGRLRERQVRLGRQRKRHSGDVGEMGVPGLGRGLDLPDARARRHHPGRTGRQGFSARHARRVQRSRRRGGFSRRARRSWSAPAACSPRKARR